MKRIFVYLLLAVAAFAAQDGKKQETQPRKDVVQRLFILKYADPAQVRDLMRIFDASVSTSPDLHAITVEASPTAMRAIEDAVQKLDIPSSMPKNIEMTAYLLVASDAANASGPQVPGALESVVTQLRNTFPFKTYSLLDVINFQTRTGQRVNTSSMGAYTQSGTNGPITVQVRVQLNSVTLAADASTLRLNGLAVSVTVPNGSMGYRDLSIQTDLDMKEGQKVVVGRLGLNQDQALFLVMTSKIL